MRALVLLVVAPLAPLAAQHVACEKYQLGNGMTVILHEDHSLPVVTINTWFRVGAKDEPAGRSGFAHLFEHLMFMGTERVPGNDYDRLMEAGGGANNASTALDRTNFYSQGPASLLPTLLWLDADRLEDLARAMDQGKLDKQRDIVRNELRETIENRPYGRADQAVFGLMYPPGHPYHHGVAGTHLDLEAATLTDVKDFFATFYVPNNASLVIAGDFEPAKVKPLVASLFGTLPAGAEPPRRAPVPVGLDHVVRAAMFDKVQLPLVRMLWHSPASYADGDAEMRLLGSLLSGGKTSRLYKRLVFDEQIAQDVSASQQGGSLGSVFQIDVYGSPGVDLDRIERTVEEELTRLCKDGIAEAELGQRVAGYELGRLSALQNLGAVADQINQYEFVWREPDGFARDLERFRRATAAQVQAWAGKVLDLQRRAVLRVLPEAPTRGQGPRDQRPPDGAAPAFTPPLPEQFALANGIPVWLWRRPELPLVAMHVQFQPGQPLADPAHAGLPALTARMLREGAGPLDALAFADAMQQLGASFRTAADHEMASATLTVLGRNFDRGVALLADALRRPRLLAADWQRTKRQYLADLQRDDDDPDTVAARVGNRLLFGDANVYAWSSGGTAATVGALELADVQRAHQQLFVPDTAAVMIAGDVTAAQVRAALEPTLGTWPAAARKPAAAFADLSATPVAGLRLAIVDRPDAAQTVIRLVAPGPRFGDGGRLPAQLLSSLLGGGFSSRLNLNLREQHGFAYAASTGFASGPFCGWFVASSSVKTEVTGAALKEFLAEFARLRAGERGDVSAAELGKAQKALRTGYIEAFGDLLGILGAASELRLNRLPFDRLTADMRTLDAITADELNSQCRALLALDRGVLVLVGDQKLVHQQLQGLDLPVPIAVDVHGAPVSR
jgi:predicted Zn-dependent peptidase